MSTPQPTNTCLKSFSTLYPSIDTFVFDIDSTVFDVELLDEFALFCNVDVSEITNQAMNGVISFSQALIDRIEVLQLTDNKQLQAKIDDFIAHMKPTISLTPHFVQFLTILQQDGKNVYFVSGGFSCFIYPLLKALLPETNFASIDPKTHLYANEFQLIDESIPSPLPPGTPITPQIISVNSNLYTAQTLGKAKVLASLRDGDANPVTGKPVDKIIMIGDGVTDLQAKPPAVGVVGFGGVVARKKVLEHADWFVYSYKDLIAAIEQEREEE